MPNHGAWEARTMEVSLEPLQHPLARSLLAEFYVSTGSIICRMRVGSAGSQLGFPFWIFSERRYSLHRSSARRSRSVLPYPVVTVQARHLSTGDLPRVESTPVPWEEIWAFIPHQFRRILACVGGFH